MRGGGICAMRGRATGRLCVVIRGVVSDAVLCLFNGVICDLPFNVVSLPIKGDSIIAHPPVICQPLPHDFFRNICDYEILNGHIPQGFRRRGRRRYAGVVVVECGNVEMLPISNANIQLKVGNCQSLVAGG